MKMTTDEYNSTEKFRHTKEFLRLNKQFRGNCIYNKYLTELSNKEKYLIKSYDFLLKNPEKNFVDVKKISNKKFGEINIFDNYNSALKKALKLSKEKEGVYGISLAFSDYKFKNGEIYYK